MEYQGEQVEFTPQSSLLINSIENSLIAACASVGMVYTLHDYINKDFATGRLVEVMPGMGAPFPAPPLYVSERRLMPPALRAFVDHVKEQTRLNAAKPEPSC